MKIQKKNNIKHLIYTIIGIFVLNFLGSFIYKRFDMTHDKRYTLSQTTKDLLKELNMPLEFTVLLHGDDFPSEFRRLQQETKQLLEEFKGTGNMELHLDRRLSEKRIYPAIDIYKSGTRKEEMLLGEDELLCGYNLRRTLINSTAHESMEQIISMMKNTKNNSDFVQLINKAFEKEKRLDKSR